MGSVHLRALRNGLVAAVLTAVVAFSVNALFTSNGSSVAERSPTPTGSPCRPSTQRVDPAAVGSLRGRFSDVWLADANDGWAVGASGNLDAQAYAVLARWDGTAWIASADAPDTSRVDVLEAVDGSNESDVWAVGWSNDGSARDALALHYDGTVWETSTMPSDTVLLDVRVLAPDDAWAIGSSGDPELVEERAVALHWDGSAWTQASLPVGGGRSGLSSIAGSAGDLWSVGYHHHRPLLVHDDGTGWERAEVQSRGGLKEVAVADGTVWLAGSTIWRGEASRFTQLARAPGDGSFAAMAAISTDRAVAVGSVSNGTTSRSLAVEVDGQGASPARIRVSGDDGLEAVAVAGADVWVAGWRHTDRGVVPLVATLQPC